MPVTEFDFKALKEYKTSSRDETLIQLAREQEKKYVGSSSSMTSVLSHFHYLLSQWRPIDRSTVSQGFPETLLNFTKLSRGPAAVFLRHKDGVYAVDADKEFDSASILMNLGKSMEKLLTLPKEEFERYRRTHANKITAEEESSLPESHHYSTQGDFIMRSQLDAHDPRLPGSGMFDLKTRAVVSIRMNVRNYEGGLGYEIHSRFGNFESYEREYYDMIRAAFLKYSLQVRVGRMDGVFVAFHNTERIFGFQYIPISEMDLALHGTSDPRLGDQEFQLSLKLWNEILDKATAKYPGRSLRLHFDTTESTSPTMLIFAQPVTDEQIKSIQEKNKEEIERYEQQLLYPETVAQEDVTEATEATEATAVEESKDEANTEVNTEVNAKVNTDPTTDGLIDSVLNEVIANSEFIIDDSSDTAAASTNSTHEENKEKEEDKSEKLEEKPEEKPQEKLKQNNPQGPEEVFCMELSIQNIVNGRRVQRPKFVRPNTVWEVEYKLSEIPNDSKPPVRQLYQQMCKRRRVALAVKTQENKSFYAKYLSKLSQRGKLFREKQNRLDEQHGVVVYEERKVGSE
jgi:Mitochondrial protein Pet127